MADGSPGEEVFEVVDERDRIVGTAPRSECHGNPLLIHRASHVLLFNRVGELLLQKRSVEKLIQPGRWDSSVGGHVEPGESYRQAAVREMKEELGVSGVPLTFLFNSRIRNEIESENTATYLAHHDGPFEYARREISEVRFWSADEIDRALGQGLFTPNFEDEWHLFQEWRRHYQVSRRGVGMCAGDALPNLVERFRAD